MLRCMVASPPALRCHGSYFTDLNRNVPSLYFTSHSIAALLGERQFLLGFQPESDAIPARFSSQFPLPESTKANGLLGHGFAVRRRLGNQRGHGWLRLTCDDSGGGMCHGCGLLVHGVNPFLGFSYLNEMEVDFIGARTMPDAEVFPKRIKSQQKRPMYLEMNRFHPGATLFGHRSVRKRPKRSHFGTPAS